MAESEESQQQQQQEEVIDGAGQIMYGVPHQYQAGVATGMPVVPNGSTSQQQQQYYHHHHQQQQEARQQGQLREFWDNQMHEVGQATDFKNHSLPLARIKKIMKADEDVRMISSEAPVVFAKACEMFIMELTKRSWMHTEENKRTLQKNDIAAAISKTDVYDFLVDIIPRDELREEGPGVARAAIPLLAPPADPAVPYYYVPQQQHAVGQGGFYPDQHRHPPPPYMPWQQPPLHQNHDENGN